MDPFKKPYNSWLISITNSKTDLHIPVITILSYFLMHLVEDKRPYGNDILSGNTYMSGSPESWLNLTIVLLFVWSFWCQPIAFTSAVDFSASDERGGWR